MLSSANLQKTKPKNKLNEVPMRDFIAKYWLETLFTTVIGVFIRILVSYRNKFNKLRCSYTAMECVMLELSKSKMLDIYYKYKDVKRIPLYWLECFEGLYKAYQSLGGNGIMTKKHDEVLSWDIEED